ncbi:MATE family efflux transporter [Suipraeoptans intestinalis]|uniref:MATE family efflux transporter n=1 Tax=Suipraeoptans intestinalis TaxID=2606628 RepID=UPI002A74A97F|nr:MATE family efflux transporter [Suipraeoptans intestinalis]MDY3121508.1 MATE family efflux transporter [Suipraeoptans intestinalis]
MEGRNLDLTQGVIWKQLILFFLPILAGSIFQQLYTTVDAVIIGQFAGKSGLAAIDSVHNLLKLPLNFFTGLSAGATILVSQLFGGKQLRRLTQVARTAIAFSFAGGVLLSILGIVFAPACLDLLEVPQDIYSQTLSYVRIYFFGLSVSLLYNLGAGILRAVGNSRTPFSILLLSCSLNLVLDLFFVGFLRLGASGAAATTVLSQTVSALLILYVLIKSSDQLRIRDHAQTPDPRTAPAFDPSPSQKRDSLLRLFPFRIHRESLLSILRLGIPLGLQSSFYPIANMMIQTSINATAQIPLQPGLSAENWIF